MSSIMLRRGEHCHAVLLPSRGGLLSQLSLPAPAGGAGVPVLWLAEDFSTAESGWPGGGLPLLFPFAGRQFAGELPLHYQLGGATYHMPLHGFAYALPWRVTAQDAASAELELTDSAQTHELFPFIFTLKACYELTAAGLRLTLRVRAGGSLNDPGARMPLAMGLHPYFHIPLTPKGSPASCYLRTSAATKTRVTPSGTAGKSAPFPEGEAEASGNVSDPLFKNLILGECARPAAALVDAGSQMAVQLAWSPEFRYVVLWRQEGRPFHCIEPWMGLPDALHNGEGLHWLAAGQDFTLRFELSLQGTDS